MGGNAFPNLNIIRINKKDIPSTISYIVDILKYPNFTYDYAISNLMGSAMKQHDSGDLDIALNNTKGNFFENVSNPVFDLHLFLLQCNRLIGNNYINFKGLKGGQIQTAWPVNGKVELGFVQVDFISGNPRWLKFSHWSPGLDISPWKGVMISTMLGVLAKQHVDFELKEDDIVIAKIGLYYDIEKGLHRKWMILKKSHKYVSEVSSDYFETHISSSPRFSRIGYITDPEVVVRLLFGSDIPLCDIETFEDLIKMIHIHFKNEFHIIKEKFMRAFSRSAGTDNYNLSDVETSHVWNK